MFATVADGGVQAGDSRKARRGLRFQRRSAPGSRAWIPLGGCVHLDTKPARKAQGGMQHSLA